MLSFIEPERSFTKKDKTMKKLLLIVLIGCASVGYSQKIGLLMDSYVVERWLNDRNYMCEEITKLGGECLVKVAEGVAENQLTQAKELIKAGAKVLIVVPVDIKEAVKVVDYATENGVKVIAYDRIIPTDKLAAYLSFDNEKVGMLQAEYAIKNAPKGNYVLMNGPKSDYNAILFRKGQLQVLKPYEEKGDIKILEDIVLEEWGELNAFLEMQEQSLTLTNEINAVVAANDALASGVISALGDESVVKPMYITGQDAEIRAVRNLKKDLQDMTVYKPIKDLAKLAAKSAMKLANNESINELKYTTVAGVKVKAILLEPKVVTKDNYMETVVADGHVTVDELVGLEKE